MKPNDQTINIGTKSAYLRISSGLAMLALGTARMIRKPGEAAGPLLAMFGACKTAEGIARYCPMKEMMDGGMDAVMKPEVSGDTRPSVPSSESGTGSSESGEMIQAFSYGGYDSAGSEQNRPSGQNESVYKNGGESGQGQKKDPMQSI